MQGAGALPFFGPNCYGFVNFFDGVALWPDQVVGPRRERGVALICQSGTIALTLHVQRPLAAHRLPAHGRQPDAPGGRGPDRGAARDERASRPSACTSRASRTPRRFARAADTARAAGKPIALVKSGRTEAASAHRAQPYRGAGRRRCRVRCLLRARPASRAASRWRTLCETLKIFHAGGPLPRPPRAGHGRLRRRHGDDRGRCRATWGWNSRPSRAGAPAHAARDPDRARARRQSVRLPHLPVVRPPGAAPDVRRSCCAPATMRSASCSTARRRKADACRLRST